MKEIIKEVPEHGRHNRDAKIHKFELLNIIYNEKIKYQRIGNQNCQNYRGITLFSTGLKLFETIL